VPKEQARINQQEVLAQEAQEAKEQDVELPGCVDHQPSSFEKRQALEHYKSPTLQNQLII
jgi:hypothetical protein